MSDVKTTTLSTLRSPAAMQKPIVKTGFDTLEAFELTQRIAKLLASSSIVPDKYRDNISNCAIALNMAARMGADPLMVMQNLVIVHGNPTWSSKFLIATVNTCGRFTSLRYEFFGEKGQDSWGCRAWAVEKATGEKLVGADVTIKIAKSEGWYDRNGSKWQTMPQQMLMYRAASWWTRVNAPEISMGLYTTEEIVDIVDVRSDGSFAVTTEALRSGPSQPAEVVEVPEKTEPKEIKGPEKETTNPETGEVTRPQAEVKSPEQPDLVSNEPVYTFAQVNNMLVKSKSMQALDEAADCIRYVKNEQHQEELRKVYQSLRNPKD